MDITLIKAAISKEQNVTIPALDMVRQFDQVDTTKPTEWLSHWNPEGRIRVVMHEDVFKSLKADPTRQGLAYKRDEVSASGDRLPYVQYVIITPRNIEGTF